MLQLNVTNYNYTSELHMPCTIWQLCLAVKCNWLQFNQSWLEKVPPCSQAHPTDHRSSSEIIDIYPWTLLCSLYLHNIQYILLPAYIVYCASTTLYNMWSGPQVDGKACTTVSTLPSKLIEQINHVYSFQKFAFVGIDVIPLGPHHMCTYTQVSLGN